MGAVAVQQQAAGVQPVQEGSRWRYARPSSEDVGAWFKTVPLDEGMKPEDFVSGVVLIPAAEKVKKQRADLRATEEIFEITYTPYMRVDTRVAYFHKLAAATDRIAVIEAVQVPQVAEGAYKNDNMPDGFWWHIITNPEGKPVRFLCCTQRVALYREEDYFKPDGPGRPARWGISTKQVLGGADQNGLAKAETGAIGRALGVAGILVVGTGIATAEDMQDLRDTPEALAGAALPVEAPDLSSEQVNERLLALQEEMKSEAPEKWVEFAAWWSDRAKAEGWGGLADANIDVRRGMVDRMGEMINDARRARADEGGTGIVERAEAMVAGESPAVPPEGATPPAQGPAVPPEGAAPAAQGPAVPPEGTSSAPPKDSSAPESGAQ